jgi:metal-responsive CopG/Arc/MetJ family transcriptional regulator
MNQGTFMRVADRQKDKTRISIDLTSELRSEISTRAKETGLSMNRAIQQLLQAGLKAERQKKQRLEEMLRHYRDCSDPQEAKRLGDELGAMIFGR